MTLLNKFPTMGMSLRMGVLLTVSDNVSLYIPPITTIVPSAINNFVVISVLETGGLDKEVSAESLLILTSIIILPSPTILGVTSSLSAASLNSVDVPSDEVY